MALENKLGITSSAELAREEERISKKKAAELFESGTLDTLPPVFSTRITETHALCKETYIFYSG